MVTMSDAHGADATATDGVVLIDQSRALAGNVTPGDAPGFPVTISEPGSYRLASDLNVPGRSHGIEIAADDVTLDLGGFTITWVGGVPRGLFDGIANGSNQLSYNNLIIRNGTVHGFPGFANVFLPGSRWVSITQLSVYGSSNGIAVGDNASITHSAIHDHAGAGVGIQAGGNSLIMANVIFNNGADGINAGYGSLISGNTVYGNAGNGIVCSRGCAINTNTIRSNSHSGIYTVGSTINTNTITENHDSGVYCDTQCLIESNVATTTQNGDGIRTNCPSVIRGNLASSIAALPGTAPCIMSDNIPSP
jgi:hypothetical protein